MIHRAIAWITGIIIVAYVSTWMTNPDNGMTEQDWWVIGSASFLLLLLAIALRRSE